MDFLLRRFAEWKGRRKAAQIIVFDGGAEVERARSFIRGALTGAITAALLFILTAPRGNDPVLVAEIGRKDRLLAEANDRMAQAIGVAEVCLVTAQRLESTLQSYETFLSAGPNHRVRPAGQPVGLP